MYRLPILRTVRWVTNARIGRIAHIEETYILTKYSISATIDYIDCSESPMIKISYIDHRRRTIEHTTNIAGFKRLREEVLEYCRVHDYWPVTIVESHKVTVIEDYYNI